MQIPELNVLVRFTVIVAVLAAAVAVVVDVEANAQEYDIFDEVRPSATEKLQSGNGSSLTPLERLSLGFEGCAAYGSLEACSPDQLERDRQLFNSLTEEEWNLLPQDMRDFWGPLREDRSEVLYDYDAEAWYVYYPATGEWHWY